MLHVHFLLWPIQFLSLLKPSWKIVSSSNGLDVMWWCCDVEGTLMTSWIIKRGLTTSSPVTECSRRGSRQRHLSLSRTSSQPSNQGIRSKQNGAKSKQGNFQMICKNNQIRFWKAMTGQVLLFTHALHPFQAHQMFDTKPMYNPANTFWCTTCDDF